MVSNIKCIDPVIKCNTVILIWVNGMMDRVTGGGWNRRNVKHVHEGEDDG